MPLILSESMQKGAEWGESLGEKIANQLIESDSTYLYVDVGGGSTEFTLFSRGKIVNSKSFKIGTVRLINNKKSDNKIIFNTASSHFKPNCPTSF